MGQTIDQLIRRNKEQLAELEKALGYRFTDLRLLQRALIHPSYAFENAEPRHDYERLEFLGDAVLDLVVGHLLMRRWPKMREGELTRLRASMVNEHSFAGLARRIDLGSQLQLGRGEEMNHGREKSRLLSCAWEAVAGALFEDSDYPTAVTVFEPFFTVDLEQRREELSIADAKSRLQEELQELFGAAPRYTLEGEEGPAHAKRFTVAVRFGDKLLGRGTAGSKKEAEQRAAQNALNTPGWLEEM